MPFKDPEKALAWRKAYYEKKHPKHEVKPIDMFLKKVSKTETCWLWTAGKDKDGYGQFWSIPDKKGHKAHRIAYELYVGIIPDGMLVCHKCDNPSCVNPDHLFLDTYQGNMNDKVNKNRQAKGDKCGVRGEKHCRAKNTDREVKEIRERFAKGETQPELAKEFNVLPSAISRIVNNKRRKERFS